MQFIVRPAAAADIDEAFLWYEHQRRGLGDNFLGAAQASIECIAEHPLRYPVVGRDTRRVFLQRFPYAIYYRVYGDIVVVVACMHGRRSPSRWRSRA